MRDYSNKTLWGPSLPRINTPPERLILSPSEGIARKLLGVIAEQEPGAGVTVERSPHPLGAATVSTVSAAADVDGFAAFTIISGFLGAPAAVVFLEPYLAAGTKTVWLIGPVGMLSAEPNVSDDEIGDLLIPTLALVSDGTSPHYGHSDQFRFTALDDQQIAGVVRCAESAAVRVKNAGSIITTDAPFRETEAWCRGALARGANFVDMESAAVTATCAAYGSKCFGFFLISDIVSAASSVGFSSKRFKAGRAVLTQALSELLRKPRE